MFSEQASRRGCLTLLAIGPLLLWTSSLQPELRAAPPSKPAGIEFSRDIRPILSEKCFACHGPDKSARKATFRLDTQEGILTPLSSGALAIVPGDPSASPLWQRISSVDKAVRMPPAYLGHDKLTDEQIGLIRKWIERGAKWQSHWSFIAPRRVLQPAVESRDWPRNPIDYFILGRLEGEGLQPSAEADATRLIRRLALDLTGLPPTPAEVDAFLEDASRQAYEKVVDRLLQSPRFGERMAANWLDVARYADTNGYQSDGKRNMWRWRDWVIDAFNRNLPFDRFTIEQIAGDMLPDANRDQIIATGFNRNHRTSAEGGIIDEEFRVDYVADRLETTSTVWLGLTIGCARCHDHKFDPISQKEYYQLFAYFNNVPENGFVYNFGNEEPLIKAPVPEQEARLHELDRKLAASQQSYAALRDKVRQKQSAWEGWVAGSEMSDWSMQEGLLLHFPLDGDLEERAGIYEVSPSEPYDREPDSEEVGGLEAKRPVVVDMIGNELSFVPGRLGQAGRFDGRGFVNAGKVVPFDYLDSFSLGAWIYPTSGDGAIISSVQDQVQGSGHGLYLRNGRLRVNFTKRWSDLGLRLETEEPLELNRWQHVLMTYDGRRKAEGLKLYVNGESQQKRVLFDKMLWPMGGPQSFRIGAGEGTGDRFQGYIDEVRVYRRMLSPEEAAVLVLRRTVSEIVASSPEARSPAEANKLRFCFLDQYAPAEVEEARRNLAMRQRDRREFLDSIPSVMVMKERETRRETFLLKRGAYDAPGARVLPDVPKVLPPLDRDDPNNRLGFARWLVDPSNPLTARVAVNRLWQMLFGVGLVKTGEDFGTQGERPLHPGLLDWLALEFVEEGWDIKAILKTIVMSATYRQSSRTTPELLSKDPENRLLARGPRFRLPAAVIRDQALAISGLLVEEIGGPPVRPYQPPGLWVELAFAGAAYQPDQGENLHRRSLYTYWKRTIPPPAMTTFDAANRETCAVRSARTNTPLQALNLMNDKTYVESANRLAQRMMKAGGSTTEERIAYGFRLATARLPQPRETRVLGDVFVRFKSSHREDPEATQLFLAHAGSSEDQALDPVELAAYTGLASLILNLDETITKE